VEISFRTKKLEKQYCDVRKAEKAYGRQVARRYIQRINIIKSAKCFDDLYAVSVLKLHPLKGDRDGQYAIMLTGFYRLIICRIGESYDIVRIEEVSKHYGN
jgi:proteic killer suppression protein